MAAYILKGKATGAVAYDAPGAITIQENIDIPDLIAHPDKLALVAAPNVGLSSFTGFAQNDTLQIPLPAGFLASTVGVNVTGVQATTLDLGDSSAAALWLSNQSVAVAGGFLTAAVMKVYPAADYILITFDQAVAYTTVVMDVFAFGAKLNL